MKDSDNSALQKAVLVFQTMEPVEMSVCSRASFDDENSRFQLRFLGEDFLIGFPDANVKRANYSCEAVDLITKILLIHYLIGGKNIPFSGELMSFRALPSGVAYNGAFLNRAVYPVAEIFASDSTGFKKAVTHLGGTAIKHGDLAFTIPVLPRLPLVYVLWLGDDELPASVNILFDSTAQTHLHTEDLAVLGEITTARLISTRKQRDSLAEEL
ncbi:hypothetical protein BMS3Abin16_00503 [archaeon BMS3Abin16]|nr:hypothetical protein BMS3Abin16_00503 [archaeon BMS3Abin16]GBE56591.1 hypothetical protein BMS3Bbin16_00800 [archaeon BMS3Bbin16]HDY73522.1 DUF3786 domain-containing protein [Euryarchaeota archaeon]